MGSQCLALAVIGRGGQVRARAEARSRPATEIQSPSGTVRRRTGSETKILPTTRPHLATEASVRGYWNGLGFLVIQLVRFTPLAGQEQCRHDRHPDERKGHPVRVGERVRGLGQALL